MLRPTSPQYQIFRTDLKLQSHEPCKQNSKKSGSWLAGGRIAVCEIYLEFLMDEVLVGPLLATLALIASMLRLVLLVLPFMPFLLQGGTTLAFVLRIIGTVGNAESLALVVV